MVRSKVHVKYIEDAQRRRVCFSKRRAGLMKKAHELSVLCNADIGLIVFSCTGKLHHFASSDMNQMYERYLKAATRPTRKPRRAQPDMLSVLGTQVDEIKRLKEKVMALELENMSLVNHLQELTTNNQAVCYENDYLETTLTLRTPSLNEDP